VLGLGERDFGTCLVLRLSRCPWKFCSKRFSESVVCSAFCALACFLIHSFLLPSIQTRILVVASIGSLFQKNHLHNGG